MLNLEELIEKAKDYQMTPEEQEEERISFAYGNLAIENPKITKEIVRVLAAQELKNKNRD